MRMLRKACHRALQVNIGVNDDPQTFQLTVIQFDMKCSQEVLNSVLGFDFETLVYVYRIAR